MAKKKTDTGIKSRQGEDKIVVNKIDLRQIERQHIDIRKWRNAIQAAESIQNPNRRPLYDIYADILLDAHLTSCVEKRKSEICNLDVVFSRDGEPVDEINRLIAGPWFERFIRDVLDAKFWGFTALEFLCFESDNVDYQLIDRRYVKPEFHSVVRSPNDRAGWDYLDPQYEPWILFAGEVHSLGLLEKAAQYAIYKRNALADNAQFCELYGQPIRVAKYNPYDQATRQELQRVMDEAGSNLSLTLPEGTSIEFIESKNNASSTTLFDMFTKACDNQISKLFLHETLTTAPDTTGTLALGEVHERVADAVHASDRRFILSVLNYDLRWRLAERGYPADGEFTFAVHTEVDLNKQIAIDQALSNLGVPLDDDYFYERYGRPRPEKYEQLKEEHRAALAANSFASPVAALEEHTDIPPQPYPRRRGGILARVTDFFR